jgi:hypothetical protein
MNLYWYPAHNDLLIMPADELFQSQVPPLDAAALSIGLSPSRDRRRSVVVKVVMQQSITTAEFLCLKEEIVVHQRQGVEDVEFVLPCIGKECFEWSGDVPVSPE